MRCLALLAFAITISFEVPAIVTDTKLSRPVSEMAYQARFSLAAETDSSRVELCWSGCCAEFAVSVPRHDDPFIEPMVHYSIIADDGSVIALGKTKCAHASEGFTIALTANWPGARIAFGGRNEVFAVPVPFDFEHPLGVRVDAVNGAELLRHSMVVRPLDEPPVVPFTESAAIEAYLNKNNNPIEGTWEYLDRDMPVEQARLGEKYSLAIVADGEGKYYIIDREEFSVKGVLSPTPFVGHFNLLWYTSDGIALTDETSATLQVDGHVLALKFGTLGATVRFAKSR